MIKNYTCKLIYNNNIIHNITITNSNLKSQLTVCHIFVEGVLVKVLLL